MTRTNRPATMPIPRAWSHLPFFREDWPTIQARLAEIPDWLPGPDHVFAALERTQPDRVRAIILGQDPYPTPGHANGLAFSVPAQTPLPRSLTNIFAELKADIGKHPETGDLQGWADQGVLLLNTSLSTMPGRAGVHARWGWERLAREVMRDIRRHGPVAFLLWGKHAQLAAAEITGPGDLVLASAHPSPLSARRGFFGSRPFSRINSWLQSQGHRPIDWTA